MHVSKVKLDKDFEQELFSQFWYYIGKINNYQKTSDFFSDFFTDSEKIAYAKRFFIAVLITRERSFVEIGNALHVSSSTILGVSSWIKNAKPETQKILKSISLDKNIENMSDKIDEFLDKLPPRIYTNWKDEFKERRNRQNNRLVKESLR